MQQDPPNQNATTAPQRLASVAGPFALVAAAAASSGSSSVGDPDGTRAVTAIVALLAVLGIVLVMVAVWLFRTTRPDPEVLAPLEIMGDRSWRRADPVWQRRKLDEVRPEGAEPLQPSAAPPDFDEAFDLGPTVTGFDDLHEDRQPANGRANEPEPDRAADAGVDPTVPVRRDTIVRISTEPPVQAELPLEPAGPPIDPLLASRLADDGARTPTGIPRPVPEDLPVNDVDPALLAVAMAELDAELARVRSRRQGAPGGE